ncbi:hypothetical protein DM860_008229 [Cuscuta australis]|uniref:Uncharacterized protein n=1 Tax=Cuscuta australis TaxID=267555 RepID=A0A328D6W6_9ASTE|nr:hypothetical protein DM860_008229 [Cuscuta australis]
MILITQGGAASAAADKSSSYSFVFLLGLILLVADGSVSPAASLLRIIQCRASAVATSPNCSNLVYITKLFELRSFEDGVLWEVNLACKQLRLISRFLTGVKSVRTGDSVG